MPSERFFCDTQFDSKIHLNGEELHHLKKVMRVVVGEEIELINGKSELAKATVISYGQNEAVLDVHTIEKRPQEKIRILIQAIPRQNHLDYIIEKGTELGATTFTLFPGELSEKKELSETQLRRLRAISIAALKQCGRLDLPHIEFRPPISRWSPFPIKAFFGDTDPQAKRITDTERSLSAIAFFIGPEKGFSKNEITILTEKLHVRPVRLHDNILRVETAASVALSLFY